MSEQKIPIPAMLYNAAVGGHVTNSQQIIDENLNREQNDINQETVGAVPYNSTTPNGMGRIVLKKNDNFKEVVEAQTNGNTIFVIKYDFTLTNDVTIPANCVLRFDGGSISGAHTLTGNNTGINAGLVKIFNTNVTLAGTWSNKQSYIDNYITSNNVGQSEISNALTVASNLVFNKKTYRVSNISISDCKLIGNEASIQYDGTSDGLITIGNNTTIDGFKFLANSNYSEFISATNVSGIFIKNCIFVNTEYSPDSWGGNSISINDSSNINIDNCHFIDGWNDHEYNAGSPNGGGGHNQKRCIEILNHGQYNVHIKNCYANNVWSFLYAGNVNNLYVENNNISDTADTGIFDRCTAGVTSNKHILNNTLKNIGKTPIKILDSNNNSETAYGMYGYVIGNYVENGGIFIGEMLLYGKFDSNSNYDYDATRSCKYLNISNNMFVFKSTAASNSFFVGSNIDSFIFNNNTIISEKPISFISGCKNVIAKGNSIETPTISLDHALCIQFENNYITMSADMYLAINSRYTDSKYIICGNVLNFPELTGNIVLHLRNNNNNDVQYQAIYSDNIINAPKHTTGQHTVFFATSLKVISSNNNIKCANGTFIAGWDSVNKTQILTAI